jgi:SAM-dependent methyltransferase
MENTRAMPPKYSHVPYPSDYMQIAIKLVVGHFENNEPSGIKILDLPAGNGWLGEQLANQGYTVVSADINQERADFAQVDMEKSLPFDNEVFDAVICCEGIEHVFSPFHLFSEFHRVCKQGGILIITTPNIQNLYSRIQFLCTGYLFQFDPFDKQPLKQEELSDKGHISPVGLTQLIYWANHFGFIVKSPKGSRYKKRWLLPLLTPLLLIGVIWSYNDWRKTSGNPESRLILKHLFTLPSMLSRSIIFSATKTRGTQD